jgi:hypothetical protein
VRNEPAAMSVEVIVKLAVTLDTAVMGRALESCIRAAGASLAALHPTTSDRELASYFVATAPADRLDDVIARLARCPGVEAAYARPAAAPTEAGHGG